MADKSLLEQTVDSLGTILPVIALAEDGNVDGIEAATSMSSQSNGSL